jgi:acetyl-CoA C-acetyltransferase
MKEVFIVSAVRTPIGSFNGSIAGISASQLGAIVIKEAINRTGIIPGVVSEVYMGNVYSAGLGQAPARQAAIFAGLPTSTICTTVNKVCASGMKAVMLAAESIMLGYNDVAIGGGMESMSNVPYYLDKARSGYRLGHGQLTDGIIKDGLWDVYKDYHMGNAAELCAKEYGITREEQDAYAIESYKRTARAHQEGLFKEEIVPVSVPQRGMEPMMFVEDEEFTKVDFKKVPMLKPVFVKDGTVTAANASTINDGASALLLMSKEKMEEYSLKPIGRILSFADAAQAPEWFTTSPSKAIPIAIQRAKLKKENIDYYEINEAFSVVSLANNMMMNLDPSIVNVNGGAVSLGHPLGCSGARILTSLVHVLHQKKAKYGAAGICNGGGGASAMIIEAL